MAPQTGKQMVWTPALFEAVKQFEERGRRNACTEHAMFLSDTSLPLFCFLIFLIVPVAALSIVYLMKLGNPKLSEPIETVPLPGSESNNVPITPPPAYETHSDAEHPSTYSDVRWGLSKKTTEAEQDEDAAKFVKGTATLAVLAFLLFLDVLSIDGAKFCHRTPVWLDAILWTLFSGLCLFALRGLGAWIVLFRNLWGKQARERLVIRDDVLVKGIFFIICLPYGAAVTGVKTCQNHLCGGAGSDADLELGVTPSSARFPPDVRDETDDAKPRHEEEQKDVDDEEPLDNHAAESRGLLSGQAGASSS